MATNYKYLFPYEIVPARSRIIIYGAGELGQDYLLQMMITNYCNVVAIADRNYLKYPPMAVSVISPDDIHNYEFDYVVIALRMQAAHTEILRVLHDQDVTDDKIVCIFERNDVHPDKTKMMIGDRADFEGTYAFDLTAASIAVLSTGGFGDMVIQKRFIMELIKYAPECRIDFYNIKAIDFLKHLYDDTDNVNQVIDDLGYRYRSVKDKYNLAINIEACHFVRVDVWHGNLVDGVFPYEFARRIMILKDNSERENIGLNTPAHLTMIRRKYKGLNVYSGFNYDGAFNIVDKNVNIPLAPMFKNIFRQLRLDSYMTVNFGNGDSEKSERIAKSWKKESFEEVLKIFKGSYPDMTVVQLGSRNAYRLKNVDRYMLGEDFRLVIQVLNNSTFHLDIEGGLVHIASQLGTKCIVLFGPTVPDYYGYEQNTNIRAGNCHECWGLYSEVNRCARDMKEPVCMNEITPQMVMATIDEYMGEIRCERV